MSDRVKVNESCNLVKGTYRDGSPRLFVTVPSLRARLTLIEAGVLAHHLLEAIEQAEKLAEKGGVP